MAHVWKFFRAGGFDQANIESGADLKALPSLDAKLWVATACPAKGLEFDPHTLMLLDTDADGRIRVPEVLAATDFATRLLNNADDLLKGSKTLPLSAINTSTDEGKQLLASAKQILKNLGKADATSISPEDTTEPAKIFAKTLFNGDGVIPPESAEGDAATVQVIKDVMATVGAEKDLSAVDGVSQAKVDQFFTEAKAHVEWVVKGESDVAALPLKADTAGAHAAYKAVKAKVDDFFARCQMASMDARAGAALNTPEAEFVALATKELSAGAAGLQALPLARIEAGRALPLNDGLNPAWHAGVTALKNTVVKPLLGEVAQLTFDQWTSLAAKFATYEAWLAAKPATVVEKLGAARLKELTAGSAKAAVDGLLAKDRALEPEAKGIASVDRLVHLNRDLVKFLNNFVSFKDFYGGKEKASFQAGQLFLDGRRSDLTLRVDDAGKHGALAGRSMAYLAYCDCTRKGGTEKLSIVSAFTDGDADFLIVGRNGIFYDRNGVDWDATITKIVEQPISIRQAFWSPYKRISKFIDDKINEFAASNDKATADKMQAGVVEVAKTDAAKPPAFDMAKYAGIFAAVGIALGALASAAVAIVTGFVSLPMWQMPLAIFGAMLLVSGPSMLLAAMKLRQRNLGPLLDANGWAVNARALINIPFGKSLTQVAKLPEGAKSGTDPFAEEKTPWGFYIVAALVVLGGYYVFKSPAVWEMLKPYIGDDIAKFGPK